MIVLNKPSARLGLVFYLLKTHGTILMPLTFLRIYILYLQMKTKILLLVLLMFFTCISHGRLMVPPNPTTQTNVPVFVKISSQHESFRRSTDVWAYETIWNWEYKVHKHIPYLPLHFVQPLMFMILLALCYLSLSLRSRRRLRR